MKETKFRKALVLVGEGTITPQIAEESAAGLLRCGVEADSIKLGFATIEEFKSLSGRLMAYIRETAPDFILAVDAGIVRNAPDFFVATGVPVVAWFVDNPLYVMGQHNIFDSLYVFTWDRIYIEPMRRLGCGFVRYLPLATNPAVFRRIPPDRPECEPFRCDISFVGSSMAETSIAPELEKLADPAIRNVLFETIEKHSEMPHPPVAALRREAEEKYGAKVTYHDMNALDSNLQAEGAFRYRARAVNAFARHGINLYGDTGWQGLIEEGVQFRGRIDYSAELNMLYSASRINLNLSKTQLETAVNQRVFDAPACGGFTLTDYREDAERLFDIDNEIAVFRSPEEMLELAEKFLKNDGEREVRARAARRNVLANHTYAIRMRQMLEALEEAL